MNQPAAGAVRQKNKTYMLAVTAVMAAVTCVLAPLSIPIGPVPLSLTNMVIYFSAYILGWKMSTVSVVVYLLIGTIGVPVFSGFTGGLGKLVGPTGGYLVGFIPMAIVAGIIIEKTDNRFFQLLGMILATVVTYAIGTAWFCFVADSTLGAAMGVCVIPFLPGDLAKMLLAMAIGPMLRRRLVKARLLEG